VDGGWGGAEYGESRLGRGSPRSLGKTAGVGHVSLRGEVGPLSGYLWLLGRRLYLKLGWRPSDTYFLGNLSDPLSLAARLKRLVPCPVDVRRAAATLARALAAALYVAKRCRDSPKWKVRIWEAEAVILDAASALAWIWPTAHKALRRELKRLGEEAPV
jgi:hypothetical protein